MLDVAMERLATRFCAVGVLERFDESVIAFARALGWSSMGYDVANRSAERPRRETLEPATLERLVERNEHDARLVQFASRQLDASFKDVNVAKALRRLARDRTRLHVRDRYRVTAYRTKRLVRRLIP
jgi:hypothetical protein